MSSDRFVKHLAIIAAFTVLALIVYLGTAIRSVETLEERLAYREPGLLKASSDTVENGVLRVTYVPVYSHIYASGGKPFLLEATISIRNLDPDSAITVDSIDYYDTDGRLIKRYLDAPRSLLAMASASYLVDKVDTRGGVGANFLVHWSSGKANANLFAEAIMIGSGDGKQISFTSRGLDLGEPLH